MGSQFSAILSKTLTLVVRLDLASKATGVPVDVALLMPLHNSFDGIHFQQVKKAKNWKTPKIVLA
jgi:hypothetical protein